MAQERFSNLTVLNSHKERTAKFAAPPTSKEMVTGRLHFKNCSVDPYFVIWNFVQTFDNIWRKLYFEMPSTYIRSTTECKV